MNAKMFKRSTGNLRGKTIGGAAVLAALGVGISLTPGASADTNRQNTESGTGARTIDATVFSKITNAHDDSILGKHIKSLPEGPSFGPDGNLYMTDASAPSGKPKVLKLDMGSKQTTTLHTDRASSYSSAQFSPKDGKLYLTDMAGRIQRMDRDGSNVTTVFEGKIDGRPMAADDIAFDPDGNMYITDFTGNPWKPDGRVVRLDANGKAPSVLQKGLSSPNGISFNRDYSRLWVTENTANRVSNFELNDDRTSIVHGSAGMQVDLGTYSAAGKELPIALDSNAVDADGNVYQPLHGGGEVLVWNPNGDLLATVKLKDNLPKDQLGATNLAIKPGTNDAYLTVGGDNGGYVYHFKAPGKGISQSNGGGATY
ncbi:SMP-30/gluconolactonase/LRE family protein [Streptomyces hawaiiensis]|uniref:SMP-30/gluconolactonase/LRE family protein n=1 Tax=Streptomyces hawaiiensis TaxID=67305 RepID=UPI003663D269